MVLVPKNYSTICFSVDFRRLNTATLRGTYPLPRMDDFLDILGDANVFITLDCTGVYYKILLVRDDQYKTSLTTNMVTHRYKLMQLGLWNSPATFQCTLI